jgi:hypothetical protein
MKKQWQINEEGILYKGSEEISVGLKLEDFNSKYYDHILSRLKVYARAPNWFIYILDNSIELHFNSLTGELDSIWLEEGVFFGSYVDKIRIGSSLDTVFELVGNDYVVDDNYLMIKNESICFMVDGDFDCDDKKLWPNFIIERIVLKKKINQTKIGINRF